MRKTQGAGGHATRHRDLVGDVPQLATVQDLMGANPPLTGRSTVGRTTSKGKGGPTAIPRINLKAVAEALMDEGLDPATEIAKVLKGRPRLDDAGKPVMDPVTGLPVIDHAVDAEVRLRTLNSLLEFTQPKLKAVEVKMSGSVELTGEQLDARIAMLLQKGAR